MTAEQLAAEVALTEAAVVNSGATSKPYFRAPGGLSNASVLETVGSLGYDYTIGWSIDPWDWSGIPANEITSIVTSQLAPGAIILLDAGSTAIGTPAALFDIITQARLLGYDFATLANLLALEGSYGDSRASGALTVWEWLGFGFSLTARLEGTDSQVIVEHKLDGN